MPKVTQAHLDARRREILEAAHRCFARRGFHAATMQEVAAEAGLSVGALYRYFGGKEALVEALAEWGREQKRDAMAALEAGRGPEGLAQFASDMIGLLMASGNARQAVRLDVRLWGEALGQRALRKLVAGGLAGFREPVAAYVRRERRAGRIRKDADPEMVARALLSLMTGLEVQLAVEGDADLEGYGEVVTVMIGALAA